MTCFIGARSARGFRLMNMRPVFCALPPPPLNELTVSTFGSSRKTPAARSCRRSSSGNEVSSDASVETVIWPMSSSGKKPFEIVTKKYAVATKVSSATKSTSWRCRSATSSDRVYAPSVALKPRSNERTSGPGGFLCALSVRKRLASIGTSVSDTNADATIASDTITANSWNSRPITPGMKKIGMNTATSEVEIEMIVKPTSREPRSAAWNGGMPCSTWRMMFSSITIASSTTRPTASVKPSSEMLSSV